MPARLCNLFTSLEFYKRSTFVGNELISAQTRKFTLETKTTEREKNTQFYLSGLPKFAFSTKESKYFVFPFQLQSFNDIIQANLFIQFTRFSPEKYSIHSI